MMTNVGMSALFDRTQKQATSIEIGLSQSAWKRIRRSFLPKYVLFLLSLFFSVTFSGNMSKIERQRKGEEVWRARPQPPHRPRYTLGDCMSFRGIYHLSTVSTLLPSKFWERMNKREWRRWLPEGWRTKPCEPHFLQLGTDLFYAVRCHRRNNSPPGDYSFIILHLTLWGVQILTLP